MGLGDSGENKLVEGSEYYSGHVDGRFDQGRRGFPVAFQLRLATLILIYVHRLSSRFHDILQAPTLH